MATQRFEPPALYGATVSVGDEEFAVIVLEPADEVPVTLTPAEREVAVLVASGLSNAEVAEARGTSVRTVANQVARVLVRLGVRSRHEVAARLGALG